MTDTLNHVDSQLTVDPERYKASLDLSYLVGAMDVYIQQLRALLEISHDSDGSNAQYGTTEEWSEYGQMSTYAPCAAYASLQQYAFDYDPEKELTPMEDFYRKNITRLVRTMDSLKDMESTCKDATDTVHRALARVDTISAFIDTWKDRIAHDMGESHQSVSRLLNRDSYYHLRRGSKQYSYQACENADFYQSYKEMEIFDPQKESASLESLQGSGNIEDIMSTARALCLKATLRMATAPHTWSSEDHNHAMDTLSKAQHDAPDSDYKKRLQTMTSRFDYLHPNAFPLYAVKPNYFESRFI